MDSQRRSGADDSYGTSNLGGSAGRDTYGSDNLGGTSGRDTYGSDNLGSSSGRGTYGSSGRDTYGSSGRDTLGSGNTGSDTTYGGRDNTNTSGGRVGGNNDDDDISDYKSKPSMGDKLGGTFDQLKGSMTDNKELKEEGKLRKQGEYTGDKNDNY
jgi:hypothetical protein